MIYGKGVCDISAKDVRPQYNRWFKMFERSYCNKYHNTRPSYIGCTVAEEWWKFSKFLAWIDKQPWEKRALDKDILFAGNKTYSEDTCMFVPAFINSLLTNCKGGGELPLGVYYEPLNGKYRVQVHKGSGQIKVGDFYSPLEGHFEWLKHKAESLEIAVDRWKTVDPTSYRADAGEALLQRANMLYDHYLSRVEVKELA